MTEQIKPAIMRNVWDWFYRWSILQLVSNQYQQIFITAPNWHVLRLHQLIGHVSYVSYINYNVSLPQIMRPWDLPYFFLILTEFLRVWFSIWGGATGRASAARKEVKACVIRISQTRNKKKIKRRKWEGPVYGTDFVTNISRHLTIRFSIV